MINLTDKSKCCGCHACYSSCPKHCIYMKEDEEGFLYPYVEEEQCVRCGLCEKVCMIQSGIPKADKPKAYAAYTLDEDIRSKGSSGGIFALLARNIIEAGGVVCGAAFHPEDYTVHHIFVEDVNSIYLLMTSKYVQSRMGECYKKTKEFLEAGRLVLFTGTPCQVNGLKQYLGREYDHLLCQDIVCHGVPSSKIWKVYLSYLEKRCHGHVLYGKVPSFRNKAEGWNNYSIVVPLEQGEYRSKFYEDSYLRGFIYNLFLRPSCYACQSKGLYRCADITLADFWGIEDCCPEMADSMGVSLVLVHTEKGHIIWEKLESEIKFKEVEAEDAIRYNPSALSSVEKPKARERFLHKVNRSNFAKLVDIYTRKPLRTRVIRRIRRMMKMSE